MYCDCWLSIRKHSSISDCVDVMVQQWSVYLQYIIGPGTSTLMGRDLGNGVDVRPFPNPSPQDGGEWPKRHVAGCRRGREEARNHMGKLARKMGIIHREPTKQKPARINETHADQQTATESTATEETEEGSSQNDAIWLSEDNSNSEKSRKDDEDFICRALKPKQLRLPRFYGDEEEFPEFWAIYETLVDQSIGGLTEKYQTNIVPLKSAIPLARRSIRKCLTKNFECELACGTTSSKANRLLNLIVPYLRYSALSESQCRRWFQRFKNGNESLEDEEHGSRPQVVDDQVLKSVIELDPRQTTRELATHFG
ncbi:hypothetical protein RB195_018855 [Necator americanus]|uniref:Mos1 transposase HTH domain-containing protein n=1 Tax=Necator americanus TaxID=51031 RepID=A0ABR1CF61_NECAM